MVFHNICPNGPNLNSRGLSDSVPSVAFRHFNEREALNLKASYPETLFSTADTRDGNISEVKRYIEDVIYEKPHNVTQ